MTTIRDRRTAGALRRTLTCGILLALAGTALAACAADSADPATGAPSAEAPSPTPTPTPLTPAEQLLADNAATPAADIARTRVSVPPGRKAFLVSRAAVEAL